MSTETETTIKSLFKAQAQERNKTIQSITEQYTLATPALDLSLLNRLIRFNLLKFPRDDHIGHKLYMAVRQKLEEHFAPVAASRPPWYNFIFNKALFPFCMDMLEEYEQHLKDTQQRVLQQHGMSIDLCNTIQSFNTMPDSLVSAQVKKYVDKSTAACIANEIFKFLMLKSQGIVIPKKKKRKRAPIDSTPVEPELKRRWLGDGNSSQGYTAVTLVMSAAAGIKLNFKKPISYSHIYEAIEARTDYKTLKDNMVICDIKGNSFQDQLSVIGPRTVYKSVQLRMAPKANAVLQIGACMDISTDWVDKNDHSMVRHDLLTNTMNLEQIEARIKKEIDLYDCPMCVIVSFTKQQRFGYEKGCGTFDFKAWLEQAAARLLLAPDMILNTTVVVSIKRHMVVTGCCDLCRARVRASGIIALKGKAEGHLMHNKRTGQFFCV